MRMAQLTWHKQIEREGALRTAISTYGIKKYRGHAQGTWWDMAIKLGLHGNTLRLVWLSNANYMATADWI